MLLALVVLTAGAQGVKPVPSIHVEGKWLVDKHGNHVVLHGVMDTPNMYFNDWKWGSPWTGTNYDSPGAKKCLAYFEKLFSGMERAKCNVFRLHLDPAWTNDPSESYTYEGAAGQPADAKDEADISKFNPNRLKAIMNALYYPLAQKAMNHGMFVVMRPPGVCPHNLKVGDYYQQYLITVWDIVSKNDSVKKHAGQISLELANEPVNIKNKNNQDDMKAMRDYFQPVVDKIRENGFTGIIWIPGTGYQSNYRNYNSYTVRDNNFGYAVHDYDGWYGCADKDLTVADVPAATQNKINEFYNSVPVVNKKPIIVTEIDWSPTKPGDGHYDEHGKWVEPNYGTWATGRTSVWGKITKGVYDHFGNISMTLSGTGCLLDRDALLENDVVTPAFGGLEEACGKACMDWYAEYWNVNWAHADFVPGSPDYETAENLELTSTIDVQTIGDSFVPSFKATFKDTHESDVSAMVTLTSNNTKAVIVNGTQLKAVGPGFAEIIASYTDNLNNEVHTSFWVTTDIFPFGEEYIDANLSGEGLYNQQSRVVKPAADGQIGWVYGNEVDMSDFKYLVVNLKQAQTCNAHLNIYTSNSIEGDCFSSEKFGSATQVVINLKEATYTSGAKQGQPLDLTKVGIISFWGDGNGFLWLKDMYLTNNEDFTQQTRVETVKTQLATNAAVYTLSGQMVRRDVNMQQLKDAVEGLTPGIYVVGGKKVVVK